MAFLKKGSFINFIGFVTRLINSNLGHWISIMVTDG